MKKFLCLILICFMLPLTALLVACDKKDHNIKTFYITYQSIGDSADNLMLVPTSDTYNLNITGYKIDINYSLSPKLSALTQTSGTPYYHLKNFYQQLLDDSLAPVYFFGESISNNNNISKSQTKQLFADLQSLKQNYEDIDYYLGALMVSLSITDDATINLKYLKKVFLQYEQAITSANRLSATVNNIYFNTVLSNPNFNYSSKDYSQLTDADLTRIAIDTRTKMYYYKSIYANVYHQLYVRNNNLAETLINTPSITLPEYIPYSYLKTKTSLTTKPNNLSNAQNIYNNAVCLYNMQKTFNSAYQHFINATNHVAYSDITASSSNDAINYGKIINGFANGISYDSYEIIKTLINLLYS